MLNKRFIVVSLIGSLMLTPLVGCENMPGNKKTQGAVIGGAGGALAGALIGKQNRLVGGLIGGALGAAGGYIVGTQLEKNDRRHYDDAVRASDYDRDHPPTEEDARRARTADINRDGFVTLNEVVAMRRAGLSDNEMIDRLQATGNVFNLSTEQENYLRDRGVSQDVVRAMRDINQGRSARPAADRYDPDYDRRSDLRRDQDFNRRLDRELRD